MTLHLSSEVDLRASAGIEVRTLVSPGGLAVWHVEDRTRPVVTMSFGFKGGAANDPRGMEGLSAVLASVLTEGAGQLDTDAFHRRLDAKAIELHAAADRDNIRGTLRTLSRHSDEAFAMLALALNEPRFDADAVSRVVDRIESDLRFQTNDPGAVADKLFQKMAYGDHPYADDVAGTSESLRRITAADLKDAHRRLLTRDALHIVVVGDLGSDTVLHEVDRVFGALPESTGLGGVPHVALKGAGTRQVATIDLPQSTIRFGRQGILRDDPDFVASVVVNHCFGGGVFSSRLFHEMREKRGLCYSVWTQNLDLDHAATFGGVTTVNNERAVEAIDVLAENVAKVRLHGMTAEEIDQAKRFLVGSFALHFDTSMKIAIGLLGMSLNGRASTWIDRRNTAVEAVTMDDAARAIERLFGDGTFLMAIAGRPIDL